MISEDLLIKQAKHKNINALEKIISNYTAYVSTIIKNILREHSNKEDLEELTADVFVVFWEHTGQIKTNNLSGYLASIARSRAYNYLKSKKMIFESLEDVIIVDKTDVTEQMEKTELSEILQDTLYALPAKEHEIMIRYYYYSQTVKEISEELKMNTATIKTKLHRSRKKLRQLLIERGYCYEEMEFI